MHLEDIVKKTNVSTIFILPIFQEIAKGITYKYTKVPYRLLPLLYENGLIKTYCYSHLSKDNNSLFLLCRNDEVSKRMSDTNRPGQTLNSLIIGSRYFKEMELIGEYCIYNLAIPPEYYDDIDLIKQGRYSEVSAEYKTMLTITGSVLRKHLLKSELSHTIVKQNIAIKIVSKDPSIKEDLEETLGCYIPNENELYEKFSSLKECLTPSVLDNLVKQS